MFTGHTFGGWNTRSDGTGKNYDAGAYVTSDGDATLYARWIPNPTPQTPVLTIHTHPLSTSEKAGSIKGSLSVSATVTPSASLSYQWYNNKSDSNNGGSIISGEIRSTFTIPKNLKAGKYYYYCVISSGNISVRSNVAVITVSAETVSSVTVPTQQKNLPNNYQLRNDWEISIFGSFNGADETVIAGSIGFLILFFNTVLLVWRVK